jgi:hypothetical protein
MPEQQTKFEEWAIVEVMGHSSYAGLVTDFSLGGAAFIRVEVPEVDGRAGFSKLLAPGSIFAITPCSKESAYEFCRRYSSKPLTSVDLVAARVPSLPGFRNGDADYEEDDAELANG